MEIRAMIYILLFILLLSISVLGYAFLMLNRKKEDLVVKKNVNQDFLVSSFYYLNKSPIFKRYFKFLKKKISNITAFDDYELNRLVTKISFIAIPLTVTLIVGILLTNANIFNKVSTVIVVLIMHFEIINVVINKIEFKLLKSFENFLTVMRHGYHEHGMVDEAVYSSEEYIKYRAMKIHINKMYKVLSSVDIDTEIDKYNEVAPNKFFKTFMSLSYIVLKFGDKNVNETSMFLSNLNHLKQEINIEILKREKLNYIFQSLNFIVLIPIFTLKPLEKWATTNLPELSNYYSSSIGFIVELIIFAVVFLSYILILNMRKTVSYEDTTLKNILNKLLKKPYILRLVRKLIARRYVKAQKIKVLLKQSGIKESLDVFYLKKVLMFILIFIISFVASFQIHKLQKLQITRSYENIVTSSNFKSDSELAKEEFQKELIELYKNNRNFKVNIKNELRVTDLNLTPEEIETISLKLQDDITKYQDIYFKWYELIICIFLGYLGTHIPYLIVLFKKRVMSMMLEDEVMQFQSIILMLMNIERMDVLDILTWMEQFSVYFKDSISICINNYSKGDIEALEQLKFDEAFIPFTRIVDNLISSCRKLPIHKAFEELAIEKNFYQDKRKQDNEIMIGKKEAMGKFIAFLPMTIIILFYLLLPFVIVSVTQLTNFSEGMGAIM